MCHLFLDSSKNNEEWASAGPLKCALSGSLTAASKESIMLAKAVELE